MKNTEQSARAESIVAPLQMTLADLEDTARLGQIIADALRSRTLTITLHGDLGAGKTAFARELGRALGVTRTINSPTFNIMKAYRQKDGRPFYHMDAYRLEEGNADLGFEECFEEGICAVEWPQYIAEQIPQDHLALELEEQADGSRSARLSAFGAQSAEILEAAKAAWNAGDPAGKEAM